MTRHTFGQAPPARINLFELPVFAPKPSIHYRNDGNAHISSMGAFA